MGTRGYSRSALSPQATADAAVPQPAAVAAATIATVVAAVAATIAATKLSRAAAAAEPHSHSQ